ncbi:MAG: beta-galactosidase [Armatimonadota bacterium]
MMDCGINTVAYTSMHWMYDDRHGWDANFQADGWKYFLECARKEGLLAEGWGSYPFDRPDIKYISQWITGNVINIEMVKDNYALDHSDPYLPIANANVYLYQFYRWGDLYYQMESGEVPIGIEDTRGWMRKDLNIRYPDGDLTLKAFQDWVKEKYSTIESANKAWNIDYKSFEEINPQENQVLNIFGHKWEFTDKNNPFHDWNQAMEDYDTFRTELRIRNYSDTIAEVRKEIPDAKFLLRTEGANVIVDGIDPEDRNPHMRHIYYSQRRCGAIADIIQQSDIVRWHSDYTTIPYTSTELRKLTKMAVEQGIIPIYLAQFITI